MKKKIFTFLLALAASVGMSWASVTWISDQYGNYEEKGYYAGTPFTKDGVTVTMSDDAFFIVSYWGDASLQCVKGTFGPTAGNYVFSNSLGENFVKIIIAAGYTSDWEWFPKGDGWVLSGDEDNGYTLTWTGNASTVTLMNNELHSVNQSIEGDIVFMFESDSEEPEPAGNLKLVEFQVPASWENDNSPITSADFPDFVATTYEIASALPVTSEPSVVVYDFPEVDEVSVYTKLGGQVSDPSTGTFLRKTFFDQQTQIHFYYTVLAGDDPEPQPEGDGKLTGAFTINANGDQILFSKGNLQYQASTSTLRFATNQYDMIGEDNINISDTYTGWIDLFGWGTGNHPSNASTVDEDYSTFTDWGVNAISNGGNEANLWRTMTIQEWNYLIRNRTNAAKLKGQATVADVHGYVLLPDSWTLPAGLSFTPSPNNWTTNDYTAEQWAQMEAAGAVFLPATGYRDPEIKGVGTRGEYWSSNVVSALGAYYFAFNETTANVNGGRIYFGHPVRLVTAAPTPTPTPAADVNITPNVDPDHAGVYYSTFFDSANKYALPEGVEAYVADLSGANLLLTKIAEEGEVIPANVAVILKSTVTPFTLTVSDADAVTFTATNDLQGSDTQIATPANCYVLSCKNNLVGFYHYTAANLNAHKAYVVYSGSQAPGRMRFIFDQATGVENIQGDNVQSTKMMENGVLYIIKNGVKYNAQGQIVK